ncbi:6-aminohexanoate hydrolase [Paenibacillaceae bacterium]|nr:6-aminohexanoate hydrolase [Paenibacillaceae bacterium]
MVEMLDRFLDSNIYYFNAFVGLMLLIGFGSLIVLLIYNRKIGEPDERTTLINLKITRAMFISLLMLLTFYTALVPSGMRYANQYLIFIVTLSLLIGAVKSVRLYLKDIR